jgi:hypothetical protein
MKFTGHVARMRERIGAHRVLVENPEERKPLGIRTHIWEDNIKMDPQEVVWGHGLDYCRIGTVSGLL